MGENGRVGGGGQARFSSIADLGEGDDDGNANDGGMGFLAYGMCSPPSAVIALCRCLCEWCSFLRSCVDVSLCGACGFGLCGARGFCSDVCLLMFGWDSLR
ncbi:hypothetical protein SUGI_0338750 [Cryptomeria japonica]|nr:hypothetical protein SUGI_0338750 [Cryptomeria japonica]